MPAREADDPLGKHGVCHLLADAARLRPQPLRREEAAEWALTFSRFIVSAIQAPTLDPSTDLITYLSVLSVDGERRCQLPGTPCDRVATSTVPMYAAKEVMSLARLLDCDPAVAFRWASRIGSIVLSNPAADGATNPTDAMAAFVLGHYKNSRTIHCDLAQSDR